MESVPQPLCYRVFTHLRLVFSHTALSCFHTPNHVFSHTKGFSKPLIPVLNKTDFWRLTFLTIHI